MPQNARDGAWLAAKKELVAHGQSVLGYVLLGSEKHRKPFLIWSRLLSSIPKVYTSNSATCLTCCRTASGKQPRLSKRLGNLARPQCHARPRSVSNNLSLVPIDEA